MMRLLKKPLITEKTLNQAAANQFTFQAAASASKHQIKHEVESLFKVTVISVRTIKSNPSTKRTGRRRLPSVVTPTKKAIVHLKPGDTISVFESQR